MLRLIDHLGGNIILSGQRIKPGVAPLQCDQIGRFFALYTTF